MSQITKVVIPAAGLGTRFLPATKAIAKEMLPLVDKPCIQYLVEEAVASGIKEIIIIIGRGKRSIKDHFDFSLELNAHLKKKKKLDAMKELRRIEKMAKFTYVKQNEALGDGHAILCAEKLIKDEPFAVLFGDDIWDSKIPPLKQLIQQYEKTHLPVVSLQKVPKDLTNKYGIIDIVSKKGRLYKIKGMVEKPSPKSSPSTLALTGKYIVTPELLKDLKNSKSGTKDKEIRLIDGMKKFLKHSPIYGYETTGTRFDTGDKIGYLEAVVHFALKHKELNAPFKKYLKGLDLR